MVSRNEHMCVIDVTNIDNRIIIDTKINTDNRTNIHICSINIENNNFHECVICLEISKKNNSFFECTRYHHICTKCIYEYRKKFNTFTCPICRAMPIRSRIINNSCFGTILFDIYNYLLYMAIRLKILRR